MMFQRLNEIRQPRVIWLYIAKEFLFSFFVCFLFFIFIFFMNQILYMAEQILSKHAPLLDVVQLLLFAMPSIVALSFPFASLVGCLMAIGRLSSDSEILIMQASGISMKRLFVPVVALGLAFSIVSFGVNDIFLPLGTINYAKVYRKMIYSTPSLELKSYSVKKYQSTTIVTGLVSGNVIQDAMIFDTTESRKSRVITAKRALLKEGKDEANVISLELSDAFIMTTDPDKKDRFEYSQTGTMTYNILLKDITDSFSGLSPSQMSSVDLKKLVDEKETDFRKRSKEKREQIAKDRFALRSSYMKKTVPADLSLERTWEAMNKEFLDFEMKRKEKLSDRTLDNYQREFQKKFAIPLGALCFVIFAFPVGMLAKRSGRNVGFGIGLLVALLYWVLLYWCDAASYQLKISAVLLMWMPNLVILAAGAVSFVVRKIR
jgi:lipopolysaccharide export system permease protein